jgi:superfamily II DNA/RNA helicase
MITQVILINALLIHLCVFITADKLFEIDAPSHGASQTEANSDDEEEDTADPSTSIDGKSAFLSQVDEILSNCSCEEGGTSRAEGGGKVLQRGLFSATIGPLVQELADSFLRDPVRITIGKENTGASSIVQKLMFVGREDGKLFAIRRLVTEGALRPPVLLFLQSKERAKELHRELAYDGINVDVMHSDRTQAQREAVISRFRTGDICEYAAYTTIIATLPSQYSLKCDIISH